MRVRFHTARADVSKESVLYGDPYVQLPVADGTNKCIYQRRSMHCIGHGQTRDHWEESLEAPYRRLQYLL